MLYATGREIDTDNLIAKELGVKHNPKNKKIHTNEEEQTNLPWLYALGDCAEGRPELTPPAIRAGKLLAERLFGGASELMDYDLVATTVFTPLEYSACGLSEEDALLQLGDQMEVYHSGFKPLEWVFDQESNPDSCYCKVIVDKSQDEKVMGIHYVGPHAGEVMQGYGVAMKCGVNWKQMKSTVGIHPTSAEEIVVMSVKKSEGGDAQKEGC